MMPGQTVPPRGDADRVAHAARKRAPDAFERFLKMNRLDANEIAQRTPREKTRGMRLPVRWW